MDLVAFRILRAKVRIQPGDCLTAKVWNHLRDDKGGFAGIVHELNEFNAYHGVAWMVNPHEKQSFERQIDFETGRATGHAHVPIWVYGIMPRAHAMRRRLMGSRNKTGIKVYPPEKFVDHQL